MVRNPVGLQKYEAMLDAAKGKHTYYDLKNKWAREWTVAAQNGDKAKMAEMRTALEQLEILRETWKDGGDMAAAVVAPTR